MKQTTKDDYLQSIYKVILYIEQNYNKNLTLEELSKVAGFSKYHFHRLFKSIVGENLSDYIRRVRLSSATFKLKTYQKITEIAHTSGYETSASFSKAFKKHFSMTPKEFSKKAKMKEGTQVVEPKILEIKPIEIQYIRKTGDYRTSAKDAWRSIMDFAYSNNLSEKIKNRYGIAHDNPNIIESDKIRYDACLEVSSGSIKSSAKVQSKVISGGKHAVFMHEGSYKLLDETHKNIGDWIVESGIELRDEIQFQKYLDLNHRDVEEKKLCTEIYIPIL